VTEVFEEFRYVDHFERDGGAALIFEAKVVDRELQGLDLLAYDDEGLVKELTVMIRPLSGLLALGEEMRKRLGSESTA
jgi:hypothetical protein